MSNAPAALDQSRLVRRLLRGRLVSTDAPASTARRTVARTAKTVAFLLVLIVLGPPALSRGRKAIQQLAQVNVALLLLGLALELSALLAYALLTRAALPRDAVRVRTLVRIQLATKALTNVVPGGSAAGSAMGYRLLTATGVSGADAGFALATAGLVSAIVLNVLLWLTLLVSIPFAGFNPIYVTVALVGVLLFGAFALVMVGLMRGQAQSERLLRAVARRVSFLDEDRMGELVNRLARRVDQLLGDRELLRRLAVWAVLNWLLDAAALWVFIRAFGASVRPDSLLVAFCAANIMAVIPLTPGGLGFFDVTLTGLLAFFGVGAAGGFGFSAYRVAQYLLPIPLGAIAYVTLRFGRWRIDREHELRGMRDEAAEVIESGESIYDWAERFGSRTQEQDREREPEQDQGRARGQGSDLAP
jgi:putative heme transporter